MVKKMSSLVRKILSEVGRNEMLPLIFAKCLHQYPVCSLTMPGQNKT